MLQQEYRNPESLHLLKYVQALQVHLYPWNNRQQGVSDCQASSADFLPVQISTTF